MCLAVNTLLTRIYGKAAITHHNYSTTLSSVAFAGTIVGMLTFGYLSDKLGRKFGMVSDILIFTPSPHVDPLSSDGRNWYRGLLLPAICRLIWRTPQPGWYACYAKRLPVSSVKQYFDDIS